MALTFRVKLIEEKSGRVWHIEHGQTPEQVAEILQAYVASAEDGMVIEDRIEIEPEV